MKGISKMNNEEGKTPFYLGGKRAMVSLGPLSKKKYCTYSCPFCYVNAGFTKYSSMEISDTFTWLCDNRNQYDIVYISGDTDSFAPPRTNLALELLENIVALNVDIMFTTRYVFNDVEFFRLSEINKQQRKFNKLTFGCVSISQLNTPFIEPSPIPPLQMRIEQLNRFKKNGIVSVLAIRPFLPIIPLMDYERIIDLSKEYIDIILGETWFTDTNGILERKVLGNTPINMNYKKMKMDFDNNGNIWKVWEAKELEEFIKQKCFKEGIPFFMRSRPAIEWYRERS